MRHTDYEHRLRGWPRHGSLAVARFEIEPVAGIVPAGWDYRVDRVFATPLPGVHDRRELIVPPNRRIGTHDLLCPQRIPRPRRLADEPREIREILANTKGSKR